MGEASAEALAHFGALSYEVLSEALSHPEMWIRIHSVVALSKIKDARVAPVLLEMLDDPEREVKKQVVQALGVLGDKRAVSALQEIVNNRGDRELHTLAKDAITKIS